MDENIRLSSSAPSLRPRIALPAGSTVENLFTVGRGRPVASPGPMTLVRNFFSENDAESDCRSFSQILGGAMLSPAEVPGRSHTNDPDIDGSSSNKESNIGASGGGGGRAGDVDFQFGNTGRPSSLVITQPPMFTIPPGLSPAILLDSPGSFLPAQGSFGMSHRQALAQVTAQAAQTQAKATTRHRVQPPMPDQNTKKQSPEPSNSASCFQPPSVVADKPAEDGYNWRKYGQKHVKGSEYPRSYYKCTYPNCPVKKQVERSLDGLVTEIIYKGQHNHEPPRSELGKFASHGISGQSEPSKGHTGDFSHSRGETSVNTSTTKDQTSTLEKSRSSDSEEDVSKPQPKRRNVEVMPFNRGSSHRTIKEPPIVFQATSEIDLLDDGYKWRKYGQKAVKGNPHPRSYYKCTSKGCNVRKHVERAASNPKAVITTYEGKHNHHVSAAKTSGRDTTNDTASRPRPHDPIGRIPF